MEILRVCEKCGKPKAFRSPTSGIEVNCACDCDIRERENRDRIAAAKIRMGMVATLQNASLLGERFKTVSFESSERGVNKSFDAALARCEAYCRAEKEVFDKGYGIYIYGDNGTGKTHLAACIVNELTKRLRPVIFSNFSEIAKLTYRNPSKLIMLNACDFLIIDDLGVERMRNTDGEDLWSQELLYAYINSRYIRKLPTIFTSNYSLSQLVNECGIAKRTVDRIAEMSNAVLKITGSSRRLHKANEDLPF